MAATKKKTKKTRKKPSLPGEVVGKVNGFPVRRVIVGALQGADYNPREISDEALEGLSNSTDRFGLVQPIVWNKRTQTIVGGHQRLLTLDPESETDVVEVDLSLEEEKALNLALNNPHTSGEFTANLGEILQALEQDVPELAVDLRLDALYIDVPAEVDDLLDDVTDEDVENDGEPAPKTDSDKGGEDSKPENGEDFVDTKQVVLVFDEEEYEEATKILDEAMKQTNSQNYSDTVLSLLRSYAEAKPKKKARRRKR